MKKIFALLVAVALVALPLTACSGNENKNGGTDTQAAGTNEGAGDSKGKEVAILTPYLSSTTTKQMADLLTSGMLEQGWTPTVVDTKNDFNELASRMEDMITSKVDAIVIVSVDSSQIADQIKKADDAGIPVFGCDSSFVEGITVNATSDNAQMATIMTEHLFEQMGGAGNLVALTHRPHPGVLARTVRLEEMLADYPDINLVTEQHVDVPNPIDNGRTTMENVLISSPDAGSITAVWCGWDEAAIGAAQAIADAGREGEMIVTGIDGNEQAVELIGQGSSLVATVEQNFDGMAQIVVDEMAALFGGADLERGDRYAPASLITA